MTNFWDSHSDGNKDLLRLLTHEAKWLAWADEEINTADPTGKRIPGSREQVEETLLTALHSTNVVVLLGAGASFCASNQGGPEAPSMWALWSAVISEYGRAAFDEIVQTVMGHVPMDGEENIEILLSLCKMSIELMKVRATENANFPDRTRLEELEAFVQCAENTILEKVNFVTNQTVLLR